MARKILTDLNLAGELELNGSAGSAGQVLISSGAGAVPSWSSAPGVGAMNYAQTQATKQSTISASGVTLVSVSITTSGYPVQVLVTGDAENSAAGAWVQLQLYRGSTAIGKIVHVEGSAGSENIPYALTVVDAPAAGTYTYSLKTASAVAGGTFNFGETDGPVLTAIELAGPKGDTGSSANTFATISTPSGTSPVADSSTDTLTYTAAGGLSITGDSTTDTIAFSTNAASANGASTLVIRDSAGSFSANVITATTANATTFNGSGSGLTNLNGSNVASGTIADARIASALTGKTYNGVSITAPATGATLTITNLKTFSVSNTLTLAGTDSTTMTFPSTSSTVMTVAQPGTLTGSPTLRAGTASAGTAPIYFQSGTNLTTAAAGAVEYDGTVFYSTPNATTGRAVDVASYYYVSDGAYAVDHSVTATAKSIFGAAATGLTLVAGTTYEFELSVYVSVTVVGTSAPAWSHSFLLTTVSGSPTTTIYQQIHTGSNTTSQATAVTPTSIRNANNATVTVLAATTTGSRHAFYTSKGIIRVTGTGSVELSPAATASATSADYQFVPLAGSYIKLTPIGNGTVAGVGTWA